MNLRLILVLTATFMLAFLLGSKWNKENSQDKYKEGYIDGIQAQLTK